MKDQRRVYFSRSEGVKRTNNNTVLVSSWLFSTPCQMVFKTKNIKNVKNVNKERVDGILCCISWINVSSIEFIPLTMKATGI